MTVTTRSSAGGTSAQKSISTKSGSTGALSKKPKKKAHAVSQDPNKIVGSGRRGGKRNIPSTDSEGEHADDEQHPTDCAPPLKRRRKDGQLAAGHGRSKSKANSMPSQSISQKGSGSNSSASDGPPVPGNSKTNPQQSGPKRRMFKRDNVASSKSGSKAGSKAARPHDPPGPTTVITSEQVEELSSSLSELTTTTEGSPLPIPAAPLPSEDPVRDGQVLPTPQKDEDPPSEADSVGPASQAGSAPLASQDSSIVPASVSGSSQVMDMSCTQEQGGGGGDGEQSALVTQTTETTTSGQQHGLTQEALESFSMEESLPRSAMDTQTSKDAVEEQDRLSYVSDEEENPHVAPTQEDPPSFAPPLFNDAGYWRPPSSDDGFIPPAPVMKDLDVFSQSQPYSSQGGTQRDFPSSSQMSFASSSGQVSPSRSSSFRYPLLPGPSSNDAAQRPFSRFESPFAQSIGTSRAVPNTKRNFALGFDAIQFDDPGQAQSLAFPSPFSPPQSSDPMATGHPSNLDGEHELVLPDDQPFQQL